ncbi:hypothetical protein CR203_03900 [Salipaludibacillus neizhouensis]|uniref:Sporulation protein YjcZ n=1 Tax=Salipaludibacillus neizhouensis TaxID=885475 RepID=A0A3A9KMQ3_9BACI|nr:hypothetical protein [Salipaludibacillus neizhouensis]RKL69185.1 hypothetical protein CR203_03900 [Salipaludibacillus neizhouensis]
MLKRIFSLGFIAIFLLLTPVTAAFAETNGGHGDSGGASSLVEGPFIIVAFATLVLMAYYAIRD